MAAFATLLALPAHATLSFTNGSFQSTSNAGASFAISDAGSATLTGWSASPSGNQVLDCLVMSGATTNLCGSGSGAPFGGGLHFWTNPTASPDGGNYVIADADQTFSSPLAQTVTGLIPGDQYTITFWQAAAQQDGPNFNGATTEQWQVDLGSQSQTSTLMNNPDHGFTDWNQQTMTFTATAASEVLQFIAEGSPNGVPPFSLLDGVTMAQTGTPEPAAFALLGAGLIAVSLLGRRRKRS